MSGGTNNSGARNPSANIAFTVTPPPRRKTQQKKQQQQAPSFPICQIAPPRNVSRCLNPRRGRGRLAQN
jgi:hypothetical protein